MHLLAAVVLLASGAPGPANGPGGDTKPLLDPLRPVTEIASTSFTIQYFTTEAVESRVQVRESGLPASAWDPEGKRNNPWEGSGVREVRGEPGRRTLHVVRIEGLRPGTRYHYRVFDPASTPTAQEARWGAAPPWRREYAVSTLAAAGFKTIIRLPVKVLLMTNVIKVESAHDATGVIAPPPEKLGPQDIERIKQEFRQVQLYYWVNTGMRLWIDYQLFYDDAWQRWGPEPDNVDPFYKGWPASRAWAGVDYAGPGGGAFTILDTKSPGTVHTDPVFEEVPYACQIEVAFLRYWDPSEKKWAWRNSGGGTLGVDGYPRGFAGRSQYLGGGDVCWLTTHEFHHQLESIGAFSLSGREDDRIVFCHFEPRRREVNEDGSVREVAWTTSGRHGEHYNGIAYWDRTISASQWLRYYFGETMAVADADGDGLPDADARLPMDERRFGSDPKKQSTDGQISDLQKVMLSQWVAGPLESMWTRGPLQYRKIDPKRPDTDGDGLLDGADPYPLCPHTPLVYPLTATVDGDPSEWEQVPPAGTMEKGNIRLTFKQAHDDTRYYGLLQVSGPWKRMEVVQDGEGLGFFSLQGVTGFNAMNNEPVEVQQTWGKGKGFVYTTVAKPGGATVIEFSYPNGGEGLWYWRGGGREIGTAIHVFDQGGAGYSVYQTYEPFYAVMIERSGRPPLPPGAPPDLANEPDAIGLRPGDPALKLTGADWKLEGAMYRYSGGGEDEILIEGLRAVEFDLWMRVEAKSDGILAGFLPGTRELDAGKDYVGFVGGYANTVTKLRIFGEERGDDASKMTGRPQTIQLSRRGGGVWLLVDGKPVVWAADPNPTAIVDRLAVIGGYGGEQVVHEIRYRVRPPEWLRHPMPHRSQ
jgi:hypothetical protein